MPILKLYRGNGTTTSDLTVESAIYDRFVLSGPDAVRFPKNKHTKINLWPYVRLELYADETIVSTLVLPTVVGSNDTFLEVDYPLFNHDPNPDAFNFRCQIALLNGDGTADNSTVAFEMRLYRFSKGTFLRAAEGDGGIGGTAWRWLTKPVGNVGGGSAQNFPLAQINKEWFDQIKPIGNINQGDTPGPLLQKAFPAPNGVLPQKCSLQIQYVPSKTKPNVPATLAFVFRPGPSGASSFQLPIDPAAPKGFDLPLSSQPNPYRLIQRPSDAWLTRSLKTQIIPVSPDPDHQEWFIAFDSVFQPALWNQPVIRYNQALRDVRSVNRVSLLPLVLWPSPPTSPSAEPALDFGNNEAFNLRTEFLVRFRNSVPGHPDANSKEVEVKIEDLDVTRFRIKPFGKINATLQFFLNLRGEIPNPDDLDLQSLSVFYDAILEPIDQANGIERSFGFDATLTGQTSADKIRQFNKQTHPEVKRQINLEPNQKVRIGSLDLTLTPCLCSL